MTADEVFPGGDLLAIGSDRQATALENVAHRLIANLVAQMSQSTGNAVVTPRPILFRHLNDEVLKFLVDSGSPQGFALLGAIEFVGDKFAVPP